MSDWVVIDITCFTKTTTKDKVIKILKEGGVKVCNVTDAYASEIRNKPTMSATILRADYESKSPDYPGSWIIEEQYGAEPEITAPL